MVMGKSGMGLVLVIFSFIAIMIVISATAHSKATYTNDSSRWKGISGLLKAKIDSMGDNDNIEVMIRLKEGIDVDSDSIRKVAGKIRHKYSSFHGLSLTVTKDGLAGLLQDPDIESIEPVRLIKASAVPDVEPNIGLIRANDTWQLMLGQKNITGIGTSICIIDTGVDYTHPDLGGCTTSQFLDGNCGKVIAGYDFVNGDSDPMDDNGHGTHVAGIASGSGQFAGGSKGGLIGVAPDAKIVAMKILNYNGEGKSDDLDAAIDWCVSNASKFNITVISMSLGASSCSIPMSCYSSYCDYEALSTSAAINSAVAANISVVISTGNDYENNMVSFPACIQNAIRVGATNNNDALASFTNRGPGFPDMLLAPGININSTVPSGSYSAMSGTSMAAPHVSGAIALFGQFFASAYGKGVQTSFMWFILNSTGEPVYDSSTGLAFSRIDALGTFDGLIAPHWSNASSNIVTTYSPVQESSFNVTWHDDRLGHALIEGNWSGQARNYTMLASDSGDTQTYGYNTTMPAGSFYWTSWAIDTSGNLNGSDLWEFSVSKANTSIDLVLNGTSGNISVNQGSLVNITVITGSVGEIVLLINGNQENISAIYPGMSIENFSVFDEPGNFSVTASFPENQNYSSNSSTAWIEVKDTLPPAIENAYVSPHLVRDGDNITISANAIDFSIGSVWYEIKYIDRTNVTNSSNSSVAQEMMQSGNGSLFSAIHTIMLPEGDYAVTIFANDTRGNQANVSAGTIMVAPYINISIKFIDHDGNANNITRLIILYNGTDIVRNQSSISDSYEGILIAGVWDLLVETGAFNASLQEVSIERDSDWYINLDWNINEAGLRLPSNTRSFEKIVAVYTNMTFSRANISMGFDVSGDSNRYHLGAFVCHDWNISQRNCTGSWDNVTSNATFDMKNNVSSIQVKGFSAFAITQDKYCGDGVCDTAVADDYSESCSTCSADCGTCPKPPSDGGGGRRTSGGSYSTPTTDNGESSDNNVSETGAGYNLTVTEFDCLSGDKRCIGNSAVECIGNEWSNETECPHGCMDGECIQPLEFVGLCVPNETRCEGGASQVCNSDGTGWTDLNRCSFGCSDGECLGFAGMIAQGAVEIIPLMPILVVIVIAGFMFHRKRKATA